jgi:ribokinase
LRVAVVGHVEWAEFVRVERVPVPGEIVPALERWEGPGGGGAVAAVELARLAGEALFLTALGDDETGRRAQAELEAAGVRVAAALRSGPTRRVFVHVDAAAERTITVIGPRLAPQRADALPWGELARCDAVYLTAADADGVRAARAARVLVATPRAGDALRRAGVRVDALVGSARDPGERTALDGIEPRPALTIATEGERGGRWRDESGAAGRWQAAPLPGPAVDAYGAGDRFAAALAWALGARQPLADALAFAALRGSAALTDRGPLGAPPPAAAARPFLP